MTTAPDDTHPPAGPVNGADAKPDESACPAAPRLAPLQSWELVGFIALVVLLLSVPVYLVRSAHTVRPTGKRAAARYVGSEKCRPCHVKAWTAWRDSHHAQSMAAATDATVLGDFNGAVFEGDGIRARFYKKGRMFCVETEGPDGRPTEYEIRYTFGFYPLQQYLVPFPGGRFQCLSVAWDSKDRKWFFLYPGQRIPPGDWLHWTRQAANWNSMCAECHSTGLRKRYDPASETYTTTWTDINVGCETCHGPGSHHVEWAAQPPMARPAVENFDLTVRTGGLTNRELVELCAFCHSRRASLGDYDPTAKLLDNAWRRSTSTAPSPRARCTTTTSAAPTATTCTAFGGAWRGTHSACSATGATPTTRRRTTSTSRKSMAGRAPAPFANGATCQAASTWSTTGAWTTACECPALT